MVTEHIYNKLELTNKTDNLLTFKRYNIADKVKNTILEQQYNLFLSYINLLCKDLRNYYTGATLVNEVMTRIEVIYNNPYLLEVCDLISLSINIYDKVNNNSINELVNEYANKRLSTDEYKQFIENVKNKIISSIDKNENKQVNKSINKYINSLGYEVNNKKTTKNGKTVKYKIIETKSKI